MTEENNAKVSDYIVALLPVGQPESVASSNLFDYIRLVCDKIAPSLKVDYQDYESETITEVWFEDDGTPHTESYEAILPHSPIYGSAPSYWPLYFAKRLISEISEDLLKSIRLRFQECVELLDSLRCFQIDPDKYFYLCLWLRDYVNDWKSDYTIYTESLTSLKRRIERGDRFFATQSAEDKNLEEIFLPESLLVLINNCSKIGCNSRSEVIRSRTIPETAIFGCFVDILTCSFFNMFTVDKRRKKMKRSTTSPKLMSCKSLYAIKMTDDKDKFYDHDPIDTLKNWKRDFPKRLGSPDIIHPSNNYQPDNVI